MIDFKRRAVLKMLGAVTLTPAVTIAGISEPAAAPLLPPLEPLSREWAAILHKGIRRHLAYAYDLEPCVRALLQRMLVHQVRILNNTSIV